LLQQKKKKKDRSAEMACTHYPRAAVSFFSQRDLSLSFPGGQKRIPLSFKKKSRRQQTASEFGFNSRAGKAGGPNLLSKERLQTITDNGRPKLKREILLCWDFQKGKQVSLPHNEIWFQAVRSQPLTEGSRVYTNPLDRRANPPARTACLKVMMDLQRGQILI